MNPTRQHVLLVDNFDSFTFNLVQLLRRIGARVTTRENDRIEPAEIDALEPTHVVLAPGPGRPENAGATPHVVRQAMDSGIPMLGVCLGHQAIAHVLGGQVVRAPRLMHGRASSIYHDQRGLFEGVPNPLDAARYHSLIVEEASLPSELRVTAYTSAGEIMAVRHEELPIEGVQFHPESVLTAHGERLMRNFLELEATARRVA